MEPGILNDFRYLILEAFCVALHIKVMYFVVAFSHPKANGAVI